MILEILRSARRLDKKLEETVGRPYRVLISAGLIAEIVAQIRAFSQVSFTRTQLVQTLIWIVVCVLLVINQLGELSKRLEERSARATENPSLAPARERGRRR